MTQSFDEWFDENMSKKYSIFDLQSQGARFGFTAGAQSRQSEIDELHIKMKVSDSTRKQLIDMKNLEIDKLQKRIDDAVKCMEQNKPSFPMDFKHAIDALSILKGKQYD